MEKKRKIKPVADNMAKKSSYSEIMTKYAKAMEEGFYGEAILIDYAFIEDRLRSCLYYFGLLINRNSEKADNVTAIDILKQYGILKGKAKDGCLDIQNISAKMEIVERILKWSNAVEWNDSEPYLSVLKKEVEGMDTDWMLKTLKKTADWTKYRDEITHSLLNKDMDDLKESVAGKCRQGMDIGKTIDSQVRILKKENRIRKHLGI